MSYSRADSSRFAEWWWSIDRLALTAMFALIGVGLTLACAASPAATGGPFTAGDFRYAIKQVAFAAIAALILGAASVLPIKEIKRAGALVFIMALMGSALVLATGTEVLGARRWLEIGFMSLQPSEFLKPGFAIVAAWILTDRRTLPLPRPALVALAALPALAILALQPDYGQAFLLIALLAALLFFSGINLFWIGAVASAAVGLGTMAYLFVGHVHHRVEQYLGAGGTGYQTGLSLKAFEHGGLTGVGPGAGTVKYRLPDAHSDFIFAVAGEEFGLILCAVIAGLFCFLAVRLLLRAAESREAFTQLAGAGLATVVALQAFVNMGVAVSLLPAKGMTLPFVSYGGSSLFAVALTMGFALAMTRARPEMTMRRRPDLAGARA